MSDIVKKDDPSQSTSITIGGKVTVGRKIGFAARRAEAAEKMKAIDPLECRNRIVIEMDDSGSMGRSGMEQAHRAIDAFLAVCNPLDTSIAIYPMNAGALSLRNNYMDVRSFVNEIWDTGGTPLYTIAQASLERESLTRLIIFSDGAPTDNYGWGNEEKNEDKTIRLAKEKGIPIDTVGIGGPGMFPALVKLSEATGGIFLHFTGPEVFAKQMKYLAPAFRHMLANSEIKEKIQRGETI